MDSTTHTRFDLQVLGFLAMFLPSNFVYLTCDIYPHTYIPESGIFIFAISPVPTIQSTRQVLTSVTGVTRQTRAPGQKEHFVVILVLKTCPPKMNIVLPW